MQMRRAIERNLPRDGGILRAWLDAVVRVFHLPDLHARGPDDHDGTVVGLQSADRRAPEANTAPFSQEELARFSAQFSKLTVGQRDLLLLVVIEGRSYREAGACLGLEETEVTARLAHARRKLREGTSSRAA